MLPFINYHSLLMEWKLLIPFNEKSDGIFQINQHPSKMYFVTWRSTASTRYVLCLRRTTHVSPSYMELSLWPGWPSVCRPPFNRRRCKVPLSKTHNSSLKQGDRSVADPDLCPPCGGTAENFKTSEQRQSITLHYTITLIKKTLLILKL